MELEKTRTSADHTSQSLRAELASTEDQLFQATEELKDTVAGQREEITTLQEKLQQAQSLARQAATRLEEGKGAAGQMQRARMELQQQVDEEKLQNEELRTQMAKSDEQHGNDLAQLRQALGEETDRAKAAKEEVERLNAALEAANVEANSRAQEIEACEAKIGGLVQQVRCGVV